MRYILVVCIASLFQNKAKSQPIVSDEIFSIRGKIIGKDTGHVAIWYINNKNETVKDTLRLEKGSFIISGLINRACEAILWTNLKISAYDDPSSVRFLLEPSSISIIYDRRRPLNPLIKGSNLQVEKDQFDKQKLNLLSLKSLVRLSIQHLEKETRHSNDSSKKEALKYLSIRYDSINAKIQYLDIKYLTSHPKSLLSAFLLSQQKRRLPIDSIQKYYNSFANNVKNSSLGRDILLYVYPLTDDNGFRKSNPLLVGDLDSNIASLRSVFDLSLIDSSGEKIKLISFKGKVLVIDFWASWCKPCLENIPYLNSLSSKYNPDSIIFISISLDTNLNQWKKALQNNTFAGIQLCDSTGFNGLSAIYCKTIWVPHYVIADTSGHIINFNAPQANEPGLKTFLDSLFGPKYTKLN